MHSSSPPSLHFDSPEVSAPSQDYIWIAAGIFSLFIACVVAICAWKYTPVGRLLGQSNDSETEQSAPTPSPSPTPEPGMSVILMGRGGAGHEGGALADTIVIARILETQRRVVLLSIPRDLWVRIPYDGKEGVSGKINSAYAIGIDSRNYPTKVTPYTESNGGGELTKTVLETVTGIRADKYITIDFSGFEQAVDSIGGVDINVERAFTDYEYPIAGREATDCTLYAPVPIDPAPLEISEADLIAAGKLSTDTLSGLPKEYPCRYEMLHFDSGTQHMDGKRALKYVRSRHASEDGNDFSRSRRQKLILEAVVTKLFSLNAVTKIPTFFSTLRSHIDTDLSATDLLSLMPKAQEIRGYPITSLTLSSDNYLGQGYTQDRQFALTPLTGEGKYEPIQNWIAHAVNPSLPLLYPTIEISGNWRNSSASATLKNTLNAAGYPTKLGTLVMKNATTSATLISNTSEVDPQIIRKIQNIAGVSDAYTTFLFPSEKTLPRTDLTILLP